MFQYTQVCDKWVKCDVTLDYNSKEYVLEIVLDQASMANAKLIISDRIHPLLVIPISILVDLKFNKTEIELTFIEYDEKKLLFSFRDFKQLEVFVSQYLLCNTLSCNKEDIFREKNMLFLSQNCSNDQRSISAADKSCSSIIIPISSSVYASRTWLKRNHKLNFPYISEMKNINFGFFTYNVAQTQPSDDFICVFTSLFADIHYDALFITLQEIDFGAKAVVIGSSEITERWTKIIRKSFYQSNQSFALVFDKSLGGVYSALFVRPEISVYFSFESPTSHRLGAGGLMANKSAVLVPVYIAEMSMVIIAAHLDPHMKGNDNRIEQLRWLLSQVEDDYDYIVIIGDLNFRLDMKYEDAVNKAFAGNFQYLLEHDQLKYLFNTQPFMEGFFEGEIQFPPTYRYDIGYDIFDTSPKKRVPAYTDRVLIKTGKKRVSVGPSNEMRFETDIFRSRYPNSVAFTTSDNFSLDEPDPNYPFQPKCIAYNMIKSKLTDHRPVISIFEIPLPVINKEKDNALLQMMRKKQDEADSFNVPILEVLPMELNVEVGNQYEIQLSNKGLSWAHWSHSSDQISALTLNPSSGIVFPGETVTVQIDCIATFSQCIVVLGLEGGGATFISVNSKSRLFD